MTGGNCVLITGTTGNVGAYILSLLMQSSDVDRIWCLNRSPDARTRQADLLAVRGLPSTISSKVEFHQADFVGEHLGLSPDAFNDVTAQVTHILHCAWPVDWNRSFASFAPILRGMQHLIDIAHGGLRSPLLFFVSSIAAAGNWGAVPGSRLKVPEEGIDDWKVARFGYGQSKLVAERLLAEASRELGLKGAVCRVGQVAGPVEHGKQGAWPRQEWFPSLIISSKHLGVVPSSLGPAENVDWVPVDQLARIIVELLFYEHKGEKERMLYHHVTNPNTVLWQNLLPAVQNALHEPRVEGLAAWVEALEKSESADVANETLTNNPAVKLLPFFQELKDKAEHLPKARSVTLEVKNTAEKSPTLQNMQGVDAQWMALWMQQWNLDS